MRLTTASLFALVFLAVVFSSPVLAQSDTFTDENVDYRLELPSPIWKVVLRPDELQQRAEFIFGDRLDGHLQVFKELVEPGVEPASFARSFKDDKLRFKPGYVDGKEEPFAGRLSGVTISYEYTYSGKPMIGRVYFLQADNRSIFVLHFTGLKDKLSRIRNQTDQIARSLTLK